MTLNFGEDKKADGCSTLQNWSDFWAKSVSLIFFFMRPTVVGSSMAESTANEMACPIEQDETVDGSSTIEHMEGRGERV
jgi:hypothetical protein